MNGKGANRYTDPSSSAPLVILKLRRDAKGYCGGTQRVNAVLRWNASDSRHMIAPIGACHEILDLETFSIDLLHGESREQIMFHCFDVNKNLNLSTN